MKIIGFVCMKHFLKKERTPTINMGIPFSSEKPDVTEGKEQVSVDIFGRQQKSPVTDSIEIQCPGGVCKNIAANLYKGTTLNYQVQTEKLYTNGTEVTEIEGLAQKIWEDTEAMNRKKWRMKLAAAGVASGLAGTLAGAALQQEANQPFSVRQDID